MRIYVKHSRRFLRRDINLKGFTRDLLVLRVKVSQLPSQYLTLYTITIDDVVKKNCGKKKRNERTQSQRCNEYFKVSRPSCSVYTRRQKGCLVLFL